LKFTSRRDKKDSTSLCRTENCTWAERCSFQLSLENLFF